MDPTIQNLFAQSAARLNEIGNLAISGAQQNSERLSAMFGVRAAQANPIETDAITSLHQAQAGGNANTNALAGALAAILANVASETPKAKA